MLWLCHILLEGCKAMNTPPVILQINHKCRLENSCCKCYRWFSQRFFLDKAKGFQRSKSIRSLKCWWLFVWFLSFHHSYVLYAGLWSCQKSEIEAIQTPCQCQNSLLLFRNLASCLFLSLICMLQWLSLAYHLARLLIAELLN